MPKYQITASFSLESEIYPEVSGHNLDDGAFSDFRDDSSFGSLSGEVNGGEVSFTVEAEDEDRAIEMAEESIYDGAEMHDDNGITWAVTSIDIAVEALEWEPTVEEAVEVLAGFAGEYLNREDEHLARVAKAATILLQDYDRLGGRVHSLETRLEEQSQRINGLVERLDALGHTPQA